MMLRKKVRRTQKVEEVSTENRPGKLYIVLPYPSLRYEVLAMLHIALFFFAGTYDIKD